MAECTLSLCVNAHLLLNVRVKSHNLEQSIVHSASTALSGENIMIFSKFAPLTASSHLCMNYSDSLFSPRKSTRCVSRKRSTVSVRNSECQRQGILAATRKIKGKWRSRKFLARQRLKTSPEFKQLEQLTPQLCQRYLDRIDVDFNRLRDSEIHQATQLWEALLKPANVTQS